MNFLSEAILQTKNSKELIAYKSLLLHEIEAQLNTNNIRKQLIGLNKIIDKQIDDELNNYFSIGTRETESNALQVQTDDIRFLNGMMDKLRVAIQERQQSDRLNGEEEQKSAMKVMLSSVTYSMPQIVGILGSSQVIEIVGHERAAQIAGIDIVGGGALDAPSKRDGQNRSIER